MNRRRFLSWVLVFGFPATASAQASKADKAKCAEEGHLKGKKEKRTEFRTKHPLCTKVLFSSTCPRCGSDWTDRVEYEGECRRIRKPAEEFDVVVPVSFRESLRALLQHLRD